MLKQLGPLVLLLAACGGEGESGDDDAAHAYIVGSLVFGSDNESTSYVAVVDALDRDVDLTQAHEFSGSADVWVHGGSVFVANAEALTITKYGVKGHDLVEQAAIGFADYGVTDFGFWRNTFVAADKAYLLNGAAEYIVWNPTTMAITKTIPLPALPDRGGLKAFPGYGDRSALLQGGRLYQPVYWTDPTYFLYPPESRIIVTDIAGDTVVATLTAPCPGLDYGSQDARGNLYFSSWVYGAGGAAVLDQPATCVFEVPADGSAPRVAMTFSAAAGGREGAALRFLPSGKAMFSALHDERFVVDATTKPGDVVFADNWRFWTFDPAAGGTFGSGATVVDALDWSSGAQYTFNVDNRDYVLVASGDYANTTVYQLDDRGAPSTMFHVGGWSLRLFKLR